MATKSTRGRPKGSGIDDEKLLKKIKALIAKDPSMKPTTAIKTAGIEDPSAIRRLREKLKAASPGRSRTGAARKTGTKKKAPAARKKPARASARKKVATRKAKPASRGTRKKAPAKARAKPRVTTRTAAASRSAPKKSRAKKTVNTRMAPGKRAAADAEAAAASLFANPFGDFTDYTNGNIFSAQMPDMDIENIISSTVEKQIQIYESAVKFSPIANMLRHQAMLTDMMLTMLRSQKEISKPARNKR